MPDPYESTPYASELFGVYKPLLGWRGGIAQQRVQVAVERNIELELTRRINEATRRVPPDVPAAGGGLADVPVPTSRPDIVRNVVEEGRRTVREVARPLVATEWSAAVDRAFHDTLPATPTIGPAAPLAPAPPGVAASVAHPIVTATTGSLHRSIAQEALLKEVAAQAPHLLNLLVAEPAAGAGVQLLDPLANFDPAAAQALLSPIGVLHLYRQLFHDLGTFLGPPVGHTWVSPGATVEIYEVHRRRSVVERETATSVESVSRTEREVTLEEELSTSIKQEDAQNLQIGASASVSGGFPGIVQGSASASMSLEQSSQQSREEAHREKRTQTERISNELRRSFRTTLKTTLETEDTSSRRHVLQNTTDGLINYELRRKMRKVGVAVQHVGTRLCWQMFLDEPGLELDAGRFVHAAKPDEQTPVAPDPAPGAAAGAAIGERLETLTVRFKFEALDGEAFDDGRDEDYAVDPDDRSVGLDVNEGGRGKIRFQQSFPVQCPLGFRLKEAVIQSSTPSVVHDPVQVGADQKSVAIQLVSANFGDAAEIVFVLDAVFEPFPAPPAATAAEQARAREEEARQVEAREARAREAEIVALRERIRLERSTPARPAEDLREEERIAVYRRVIDKLRLPTLASDPHLAVELIRGVFEVDRLLFFVAQDWWRPRKYRRGLEAGYPITEEAQPARMGSSLGWFLQADGDARRDAFLNTPWVKTVLPIRPGMERAAIQWLTSAGVEGSAGLQDAYGGPEPELQGLTLQAALLALAGEIASEGPGFGPATETVYENGFDPLEGGFDAEGEPFAVFDRWVEVLPTDQVVAIEYTPGA